MTKIIDCITFYDENLLTNTRFEILKDVVDKFIVCESMYDHSGKEKKINFKLLNKSFSNKVDHIVIKNNFPEPIKPWQNERIQREHIVRNLPTCDQEDYIMYSDADEIPNPLLLKNISLKKKYGIFNQMNFVYKLNIFNKYETPWEGTRICKKKNLKSIFHLRKKIVSKNLKKPFWKFYIEKDIELISDGGWHFNNFYNLETISKKLKAFPHKEFSDDNYSSLENIKKKIDNLEDLFDRGHKYEKVSLDSSYPKYILENLDLFKNFII
jgi:beta-1,4-mannosyl-glycoprotein beta-1,4-N-acetylglucosaminyltransferase